MEKMKTIQIRLCRWFVSRHSNWYILRGTTRDSNLAKRVQGKRNVLRKRVQLYTNYHLY